MHPRRRSGARDVVGKTVQRAFDFDVPKHVVGQIEFDQPAREAVSGLVGTIRVSSFPRSRDCVGLYGGGKEIGLVGEVVVETTTRQSDMRITSSMVTVS
jgi:hypothetical protein